MTYIVHSVVEHEIDVGFEFNRISIASLGNLLLYLFQTLRKVYH